MTGLLAIGAAAEVEGLFAWLARLLPRGRPLAVLAGLLALDTLVTAVMNLDTAAAFMTPLMLYAAAGDTGAFLYAPVLMANAASLYLPGSNLTNLIVEGGQVSGAAFLSRMLVPALVATAVTAAGLLAWAAVRPATKGTVPFVAPRRVFVPRAGTAAVPVAAVLVVALREPALPVLGLGLVAGLLTLHPRVLIDAIGPLSILGLLALATAVGTLARAIDLTLHAGRLATAAIAAGASVAVNNLPAATLLSAHAPDQPRALLIGLNLGPNLAVTGSLSVLIWWRVAKRLGAQPSARTYSLIGAPLAVVTVLLAAVAA